LFWIWKDESTNKQITVNVHTKSKTLSGQNNSQTDVTDKETAVCRTSNRQKRVWITRNNFFYGNSNFRQPKKINPQQSKEGSPIHIKESNLKENLNIKDNDAKNKSCLKNDRKPLNTYHQNTKGLRGKTDELIGHLHPVFLQILCLSEHHMNQEELQQTFIDGRTMVANYCRTSYAKGVVCAPMCIKVWILKI